MKIIQILPELNQGGVETSIVQLNKKLVELGHTSIVISSGGRLVEQILNDKGKHISCDVGSKNPLTFFIRVIKLYKILKRENPNIIHVHSRVPAWLIKFANKKIPVVSTVHGFNSVGRYSRVMTQFSQVIAVSQAIKDYIIKHYQTCEQKISIISPGVNLDEFNTNNLDKKFIQNFKKEFELQGKFIITSVGRITQLKDYETLIKATALVKKQLDNFKVLIVGGVRSDKKNYFKNLKELIKQLNLQGEVIFTGVQSQMNEIYHLSDVVVSSSKKPESFGLAVAEALCLETPVIASNHGGIVDVVIQGKTGWLFTAENQKELANCLIQAKNHQLTNLASHIQENFSCQQTMQKIIEIYQASTAK